LSVEIGLAIENEIRAIREGFGGNFDPDLDLDLDWERRFRGAAQEA